MMYPSRNEYKTLVKYLDRFIYDPVLKNGKPALLKNNTVKSNNGGKAIVFEIGCSNKKYALKCWVEDLGCLKNRYKEIDTYLKKIRLSYFVDFAYLENGILVNGHTYPIIRMEWIDAISFKGYINANINNSQAINKFAFEFLDMVSALHKHSVSHGDLQHGNIMINRAGKLFLIDYDTLFVPSLVSENDDIKGIPGYQHPKRSDIKKLNAKTDYFSELVIFISLLFLSENPSYWHKIRDEERLLFSENDLLNYKQANIFKELKKYSPRIKYLTETLESFCSKNSIENLLPLEEVVNNGAQQGINFGDFKTNDQIFKAFESKTPQNLPVKNPIIIKETTDLWDNFFSNESKFDNYFSKPTTKKITFPEFDTNAQSNRIDATPFDSFENNATDNIDFNVKSKKDSIWDKLVNIWDKIKKIF